MSNQSILGPGYVHVYTGDGKGKTSAALGLVLRALGAGLNVFIGQFAKRGQFCEHTALCTFGDRVVVRQYGSGEGFIRGAPSKRDTELAREGLAELAAVLSAGTYDVVVLDEACLAVFYKMIRVEDLLAAIDARAPGTEVVVTGRKAPYLLIERADVVTEMAERKHYYSNGVQARQGIEH